MPFGHSHLLPTTVIGSHALPGWFWTAMDALERNEYGPSDAQEVYDDAVRLAIWDQREAGIDTITDGEMRRWYFVQNFYSRMKGLEHRPTLRKTGVYGYDSVPRYRLAGRVEVPEGLGIVEEFRFLKNNAAAFGAGGPRIKACCPGPLTLTMHIQLRDGDPYQDRLELAHEFAGVVNRELKALQAEGCDEVQLDEPSFAIIPGQVKDWVDLFNRAVEGVTARKNFHICFGNLSSRPRGRRRYGWMLPTLLEADADALSMEFANREMCEADIYARLGDKFDFIAGIVDVKSFWVEPPEEIAERIRTILSSCPPNRLAISPDCGFFQLPRWLCRLKLRNLARGAALVREELGAV
jgi:5-methyltetrahydropteroyltriglutamate--homocysteine methyltransferase